MGDCNAQKLRVEFVNLLRRQIEALELDAFVGLTDAEQHEYDGRQARIRDLEERIEKTSDQPLIPAAADKAPHYR
ncbi:MAG TPA: hypothetical protein VNY51_05300 [Candidatus Dormibacteraeota bacterium]|jgi:hypothetical protein|nr:hypothetical protein [Candidatus Dormibacteraeota bacterium]